MARARTGSRQKRQHESQTSFRSDAVRDRGSQTAQTNSALPALMFTVFRRVAASIIVLGRPTPVSRPASRSSHECRRNTVSTNGFKNPIVRPDCLFDRRFVAVARSWLLNARWHLASDTRVIGRCSPRCMEYSKPWTHEQLTSEVVRDRDL
jgi:hypothetical protein